MVFRSSCPFLYGAAFLAHGLPRTGKMENIDLIIFCVGAYFFPVTQQQIISWRVFVLLYVEPSYL